MRSGKLLALTLDDFDFNNKTVHVCKNFATVNGEEMILPPKTPKSNRIINLSDFLCDCVRNYVDELHDY